MQEKGSFAGVLIIDHLLTELAALERKEVLPVTAADIKTLN